MDWRSDSACRDKDPELFFPVGLSRGAIRQARTAKAVCGHCPVAQSCLAWAMATNQDSGIWGGLDEVERRSLKRRNARRCAAARARPADRVG